MNLTRSALVASLATTALWTAKAVAIGIAGGLGRSPLEGPLFLLGLVACVVAGWLTGMAVLARRSLAWRVLGGVVAVVVLSVFGAIEAALVAAVTPVHPGWAWGEINLWILMLTILAVSAALAVRRREPSLTPVAA